MRKEKKQTESPEVRKKGYVLLIVGAVLLVASLIFTVYAHSHSYADSILTGTQLSEVKELIKAVDAGESAGDLDALKAQQTQLSDLKLSQERPYSYGLTALFLSLLLAAKGLYNALIGTVKAEENIKRLAMAGLMAALCYIGFAVFKIDIPVGPGKTAFHFGNVFCVLAALLLGGFWGGLAGAIGMTIGDLTTAYVTSAPKTFLLKLCIGLIVGLVAHGIFKLSRTHSKKYITGVTILACVCGMGFNMVADPLVGYFYKMYLLGVPQELSAALAKMATVTTAVNAVVAVIAASIFYLALRPALRKAGLFIQVTPEKTDMS
ncbi:MAG: ECF transporter S component [Lachnospiraceae bacterium]|nr:ECF transporter S component [Lachnospiraceae bacterium]